MVLGEDPDNDGCQLLVVQIRKSFDHSHNTQSKRRYGIPGDGFVSMEKARVQCENAPLLVAKGLANFKMSPKYLEKLKADIELAHPSTTPKPEANNNGTCPFSI